MRGVLAALEPERRGRGAEHFHDYDGLKINHAQMKLGFSHFVLDAKRVLRLAPEGSGPSENTSQIAMFGTMLKKGARYYDALVMHVNITLQ